MAAYEFGHVVCARGPAGGLESVVEAGYRSVPNIGLRQSRSKTLTVESRARG